MKARLVKRALRKHGCTQQGGKEHEKWICLCGEHSANIPRHGDISPGVVGDTIRRMACLPEGWLQ
jgi:hypothetical protein